MNQNKKGFGEYLRQKRTEAGLTQKNFAEKLFVTESAVSKWERGLSYPDITLITDICALLGLSEHELLTASEDVTLRSREKLADRYVKLISRLKLIQYIIYGTPLLVCFIVNLATSGALTWFFIVLTSILTAASLTLLPVLTAYKGNMRPVITIAGFTASLTLLLATCAIFSGGTWFFMAFISVIFGLSVLLLPIVLKNSPLPSPFCNHITLLSFLAETALLFVLLLTADIYTGAGVFFSRSVPIAAVSLTLPYGLLFIIRYAGINRFFKASASIAVTGVFSVFINEIIGFIIGKQPRVFFSEFNFGNWSQEYVDSNVKAIIFFSAVGLAVLFAVAGVLKELQGEKKG